MCFSAGSVVLYTGQRKFHSTTTDTINYVVKQAETTVDSLRNVSDYLDAAKRIGVDQVFLPSDVQANIDNVKIKINSSAITLERETRKNSNHIRDVLDAVYVYIDNSSILVKASGLLCVLLVALMYSAGAWLLS